MSNESVLSFALANLSFNGFVQFLEKIRFEIVFIVIGKNKVGFADSCLLATGGKVIPAVVYHFFALFSEPPKAFDWRNTHFIASVGRFAIIRISSLDLI